MAVLSNRPNKAAHYSNIVVNHQRRVEYFFLTITEEIKNKNNCVPATTMTSQVSSLVVTAQQKRADSSISQGKISLVKLRQKTHQTMHQRLPRHWEIEEEEHFCGIRLVLVWEYGTKIIFRLFYIVLIHRGLHAKGYKNLTIAWSALNVRLHVLINCMGTFL